MKRRKRLSPVSDRWKAEKEQLDELRPLIEVRAGERCEICRVAPVLVLHHKLRRSQGGKHALDNLLGLCNRCHEQVHANPSDSYERGWLLRSWEAS